MNTQEQQPTHYREIRPKWYRRLLGEKTVKIPMLKEYLGYVEIPYTSYTVFHGPISGKASGPLYKETNLDTNDIECIYAELSGKVIYFNVDAFIHSKKFIPIE